MESNRLCSTADRRQTCQNTQSPSISTNSARLPSRSTSCGRVRVVSDCHFRATATGYDTKPGIEWLSCTAKRQSDAPLSRGPHTGTHSPSSFKSAVSKQQQGGRSCERQSWCRVALGAWSHLLVPRIGLDLGADVEIILTAPCIFRIENYE